MTLLPKTREEKKIDPEILLTKPKQHYVSPSDPITRGLQS